MRKFIREIPLARLAPGEIEKLEAQGFVLVKHADSIEVYVETLDTNVNNVTAE